MNTAPAHKMATALALGLLAATLTTAIPTAHAAVPGTAHLEGYLHATGGGAVSDGNYNLTFALYDGKAATKAIWSEGPVTVAVKKGQWRYALGATKPLSAQALAAVKSLWLGIKVASDPELPRAQMHSTFYAQVANVALGVSCTGCITTSSIKPGPLDLKGQTVTAKEFVGDGSKLTGLTIPSGACKDGEVVKGIAADGKLVCVKSSSLPSDGVSQVSQGLIHVVGALYGIPKPVDVPDNNPAGAVAKLTIPNVGNVDKLTFTVEVNIKAGTNGINNLQVCLVAPGGAAHKIGDDPFCGGVRRYKLHDKTGGTAKKLTGTWPDPDKLLSGDLGKDYFGKNPQGVWSLWVIDTKFDNNSKTIAEITKFTASARTTGNRKINVTGDTVVDGKLTVNGGIDTGGGALSLSGGFKLGDTKGAKCDASRKGELRWQKGDGMVVCDGDSWTPNASRPAIFQGGCTNSNPGGDTWRYRCINHVSVNTRPDIFQKDGSSNSYGSGHGNGRLYLRKDGYYRVQINNYGHMCYQCIQLYVSGTVIREVCDYHDNNRPRSKWLNAVVYIKKNDFLNVRIYCNCCSNIWHSGTYGKHITYARHNWLEVEYIGALAH